MDRIIIRHDSGTNPEKDIPKGELAPNSSNHAEAPIPLHAPRTEFTKYPVEEAIEGDIVPNPYTNLDAARANVLRAYGETEALK